MLFMLLATVASSGFTEPDVHLTVCALHLTDCYLVEDCCFSA
jgi:hypothetical protein